MKNYEALKKMSFEEMAAMLYLFIKPIMDALNMKEEQRQQVREQIRAFLNSETGGTNNDRERLPQTDKED